MDILGISCFYHDAAAALIRDGVLLAAAAEERFTRKKHDYSFPIHAIQFCLQTAQIRPEDLAYVVFYEKPFLKFERLLMTMLGTAPASWRVFPEAMGAWLGEKLWIKDLVKEKLGLSDPQILFVEHHLSHAASSLFCSPFDEAALLTIDGVGEWTTTALGKGTAQWDTKRDNRIVLSSEIRFPHSVGLLYAAFTAFLGFEINEGEYKVMGMAPYGEPRYMDKIFTLIDLKEDGSFHLDLSYFSYHYHPERAFNGKFERLFGPPRDPRARFVTDRTRPSHDPDPPSRTEIEKNQYYADLASSIQKVTEEILLRMGRHLYRETGLKKLCLAGGVGLNSVANYRLLTETPFEEVYIQPAAGDAGGAIGAALYLYHVVLGHPRRFIMGHAYWGEEYTTGVIASFLDGQGIRYERVDDEEKLVERVVDCLQEGQVVGWYQGRFEWGPRALGNRSILADPRRPEMKDIVNIKIKFREPFRPFAPSLLAEKVEEYFVLPGATRHYPARYMLLVAPVTEGTQHLIPAVTHADGTGRLQVVVKETNPLYYRLIEKFYEATGIPALLNTSFNLKGEPMVSTPKDAFMTFSQSGMDLLVMGPFLVSKSS